MIEVSKPSRRNPGPDLAVVAERPRGTARAYEHLSEESRNHRFRAGIPHPTETMLDHLVDEVDEVDLAPRARHC